MLLQQLQQLGLDSVLAQTWMYNIQAAEILNETMGGASDGNVSRFLHNLRAGQAAPPMTIEASAKVITLTATVAARCPSVRCWARRQSSALSGL